MIEAHEVAGLAIVALLAFWLASMVLKDEVRLHAR
jgi:hypothetical protein